MVEFGEAKVDVGSPIFNYSIAYDTKNAKPLFYETYLGSIADISQLEYMLGKAKGYGYKNIGFILDRGYFSKGNIRKMDEYGYSFVIMIKGMAKLVNRLVLENKGKFEEERRYSIRKHHVYGITVKDRLYLDDEKDRYFHRNVVGYAIIEDRTLSALKHAKVKYSDKDGKDLSLKIKLNKLRGNPAFVTPYVRKRITLELIDEIDEWRDERNTLIHKLAKIPYDYDSIKEIAERGQMLVNMLDNKVKSVNRYFDKIALNDETE